MFSFDFNIIYVGGCIGDSIFYETKSFITSVIEDDITNRTGAFCCFWQGTRINERFFVIRGSQAEALAL